MVDVTSATPSINRCWMNCDTLYSTRGGITAIFWKGAERNCATMRQLRSEKLLKSSSSAGMEKPSGCGVPCAGGDSPPARGNQRYRYTGDHGKILFLTNVPAILDGAAAGCTKSAEVVRLA